VLIYNGFPNLTLFYLVVSHLPWFFVWLIFDKIVLIFLTQKQSSFPGEMSQFRYISAAPGLGGVAETAFAPPQDAVMGGITETARFAPPHLAQSVGFASGFASPMAGFAPQGIPPLPTPLPTPGWAGFAPPQSAQMAGFAPPQPAQSAETALRAAGPAGTVTSPPPAGTVTSAGFAPLQPAQSAETALRAAGPAGTVTSPPPAGTVTSPLPAGQQRNTDESQNPLDLLRQNGININLNFNFGNMPPRA
jgi:hypothetical protein